MPSAGMGLPWPQGRAVTASDSRCGSTQPQCLQMVPLQIELQRPLGSLVAAIEAALTPHGRPLRWAITAVSDDRLVIEAMLITKSERP